MSYYAANVSCMQNRYHFCAGVCYYVNLAHLITSGGLALLLVQVGYWYQKCMTMHHYWKDITAADAKQLDMSCYLIVLFSLTVKLHCVL